jgi:uncharacterized protein
MYVVRALWITWFWMMTSVVFGATVSNLHTATVPVVDQSEAEFARGLTAAFQVVLVKLTGNNAITDKKGFQSVLTRAQQYNTVYGYDLNPQGQLMLRGDFDMGATSSALRAYGMRVWGRERPELMTWLVVTDAAGRTLGPNETHRALFDALSAQATIRAIPLRRAGADATAMTVLSSAISDEELSTGLLDAAARYGAPANLVGLIQVTEDTSWRAHWELAIGEERKTWTGSGAQPESLVREGVDHAVNALSDHFLHSVAATSDSFVQLTVSGVYTADDYGRALNYLAGLDAVASISVDRVEGSQVVFTVKARGGTPILAQTIGFGRTLTAVIDDPTAYQLNPP